MFAVRQIEGDHKEGWYMWDMRQAWADTTGQSNSYRREGTVKTNVKNKAYGCWLDSTDLSREHCWVS